MTARKNVSVIYETADTKISSNYVTLGTTSNRLGNEIKHSTSGLEFQNFSREPIDVLQPNDVLFGPPRYGYNAH